MSDEIQTTCEQAAAEPLKKKRKPLKKSAKVLLIVLGSIVGLFVLISILVSPIATAFVNNNGEMIVGRKLHVDKLLVNVYTGHVAIHNLKLYEEDGATEFVSFDTLDVKARLLRLLKKDVYLSHITLAGPNINLIQYADHFNFTSIIDHFKSDDDDDDDDTTSAKWGLYFYNIRISDGVFCYEDVQRGNSWRLKGLHLEVPGFCIGADEQTDAGLSVELADGGRLHTNAKYNMERNDFSAVLDLDEVNLGVAKPYLTDMMHISDIKGTLDAHINAEGNLSQILQMNIVGNVALNGFDLVSDKGGSIASCGRLAVAVNRINLDENLFDIDSVSVSELAGRFDKYKNGTNFSMLMIPQEKKSEVEVKEQKDTVQKPKESKPMQLTVGHFRMSNSKFTYADHTLPDVFEYPVTGISVESDDLSLSGQNSAKIKAMLPGSGHMSVEWSGNISNWKSYQDLKLRIKGMDMTKLSPYLVAYLGMPFTDGTFSLMSHNTINNSMLKGKNKVDIYKVDVGKRRKDVEPKVKVPLKAALYVLKDKDEKVLLDIPVSGNIDNPEFSYMKIIWRTLGNLFVKVVTSPIRAIADALGFGNNLDYMSIDVNQKDFNSEQYHMLGELAEIALSNAAVHISFEQQVDTTTNAELLQLIEHRNQIITKYMTSQKNIPASQISVTTEMTEGQHKTGYAIESEVMEAEE